MYRILKLDSALSPFAADIDLRMENYRKTKKRLLGARGNLSDFANGSLYFGVRRTETGWVYREWAPGADRLYFTGDFNGWDPTACPMKRLENGVFEVFLVGKDALQNGQKVQTVVERGEKRLRRIPLYAHRVVQDPKTTLWCAEIDEPDRPFPWTDEGFCPREPLLIYECHVGMAQEKAGIGSYDEFRKNILPRVKDAGYTALQIMAVMEHPYYGSFGYQVTNFFAASSRFGRAEDLKALIDDAHRMGVAVLLDVVHSHAARNTNEGINEFDGTENQFFREGPAGDHPAWGTKLFRYGKDEVLHFLLSNLKYWQEEFHFDGFRFDGVTSMLYRDHGLGRAFTDYKCYFSPNTDTEAVTYLQLANELVHRVNPHAITVAEDMSGMPGMCLPIRDGGIGFDYRLAMGVPDVWVRFVTDLRDEQWDMEKLWYELTTRRPGEKNVGYCESHDQALVGDKTLLFRLCDAEMYTGMEKRSQNAIIDRGVALHKMIRLLTATLAGEAYLNFMGNEFGHPEWIDFPREGNGWSYAYCRRQWSLADNGFLRYGELQAFDRAMTTLLRDERILEKKTRRLEVSQADKRIVYAKGSVLFAFNFHPTQSFASCFIPAPSAGRYRVLFSSDDERFGGFGRVDGAYVYRASKVADGRYGFRCYLPARCAVIFGGEPQSRRRRDTTTS